MASIMEGSMALPVLNGSPGSACIMKNVSATIKKTVNSE